MRNVPRAAFVTWRDMRENIRGDAMNESLKKAEEMLLEYRLLEKQMNANRYEREFFGRKVTGEDVLLQARAYEIRTRVMALPPCPEKLFLSLHFLRGHAVEKCAELMDISRSTAFRLKKKGIALFAVSLSKNQETFGE